MTGVLRANKGSGQLVEMICLHKIVEQLEDVEEIKKHQEIQLSQ